MKTNTITIVGMHRTGTSIALALKEGSQNFTLIGHDSDGDLLKDKAVAQAVDRVEPDLVKACEPADIVVLAMPSVDLEATLRLIGNELQPHTLVIDLTALKGPGIRLAKQYLQSGHYIGARPVFAAATFSDLQADINAARADLFKNSVFCVMPDVDTDPNAVETAVRFGSLLGAKPYFVDPLEYDQLSLGVETLPGVGSAALFRSIARTAGWRDILRFADLPFAVATQSLDTDTEDLAYLLMNDHEASIRWLDGLVAQLSELRRLLDGGEPEVLSAYLAELNFGRNKWLRERSENEWDEAQVDDVDLPTLGEHFLGSIASRRKRD